MAILFCHGLRGENDENEGSRLPKNSLFTLFGYNPLISEEEKELSKLHGNAEVAMQHKEYLAAEKAYEEILKKIDPPFLKTNKFKVDWPTYIDLISRLAEAKLALKEFEGGLRLLKNLEKAHPPKEYLPSIYFLTARFHANRNDPAEAYAIMCKASPILPIDKWRGEDRSFFHGIEYLLNDHFDHLLKKAKRFACTDHYDEAIAMYEEISSSIEKGGYPKANEKNSLITKKVKYQLAELYYAQAKYEKALALVETDQKNDDVEMLYLAACAFREKKEYEKSTMRFEEYIKEATSNNEHFFHAYLEIGLNHFKHERLQEAKEAFEKITSHTKKGQIFSLASFYLAEIYLKEGKCNEALALLNEISNETLKQEITFLKGEIAFEMENYALAIELYEEAIEAQKNWKEQALLKLAMAHIKAGADTKYAEKILDSLLENKPNEKVLFSLADLYLLQSQPEKIAPLFDRYKTFFSREGEAKSLLMLAKASKNETEQERFYKEATSVRFEKTTIYPECLYMKGVWEFKHAHFQEAIDCFERAQALTKNEEIHLMHCVAAAQFYKKLKFDALQKVEVLLKEEIKQNEKDEILYLRGLIASTLVEEGSHQCKIYSDLVISSLESVSKESRWKERARFALGSFFYKRGKYLEAEKQFQDLWKEASSSPLAAHALFWTAEAAEKLNRESVLILDLRQKCYEKFPLSQMAPLAYFKIYPFDCYIKGDEKALGHIQAFPRLFSSSPLICIAYYFIGLHAHDADVALKAFENAIRMEYYQSEKAKEYKNLLLFYHHKATYGYVEKLIEKNLPLQDAIASLEKTVAELEKSLFELSLRDEGELLLARCYIAEGELKKGEKLLLAMLDKFKNAGIHEGYFLSKVLMQQGILAMKNEDFKSAMTCLEMAESCGEKFLPPEEKMFLWIELSECAKKQKKYEQAMKILSRVINEDSLSPLREKAMYLRAEIYELEGRHELAIRQLEATAKRSGEWSESAKKKLRKKYGL